MNYQHLTFLDTLCFFDSLSFLIYGSGCFYSSYLKQEFLRYGFPHPWQRWGIGLLQIAASLTIAFGLLFITTPYGRGLLCAALLGLAAMMAVAVGVRIKIKDSFINTLPATFYCLLNVLLFYCFLANI